MADEISTPKKTRAKQLPGQEILRRLLDYDPETGALTWRPRTPDMFAEPGRRSPQHRCRNWNSTYAGKKALTYQDANGYAVGHIYHQRVLAHRVIWKYVTGQDADVIDHIDGDTTNNRLCNLRSVQRADNQRNMRKRKNNTSGVQGVWWHEECKKWQAEIMVGYRKRYIGLFLEKDEAVSARKEAEIKYGFHKNHGREMS